MSQETRNSARRRFAIKFAETLPNAMWPLVAHQVGAESAGNNGPQIAVGAPTYYIELQTGVISIGIQNTISLVCQGVFERFPNENARALYGL